MLSRAPGCWLVSHSKTSREGEIEKVVTHRYLQGPQGRQGRVPGAHEGPESGVVASFRGSHLWASEGKALGGGEECSSHGGVVPGIHVYLRRSGL